MLHSIIRCRKLWRLADNEAFLDCHYGAANADKYSVSVPNIIDIQAVFWGSDFPPDNYEARKKRGQIPKVFSPFDESRIGKSDATNA